jgi:hypothetical protein
MVLVGSDYLLRLASLAMTLVGFSAIIVALRRASGGELNDYHRVVAAFYIESGLAITAFCVLPEALNLTGMAAATIWRVASVTAGLVNTALTISLDRRARSLKSMQVPSLNANSVIAVIILAVFWLNAIGFPFGPGVEPYAIAVTAFLFLIMWIFKQNLGAFIQPEPPG